LGRKRERLIDIDEHFMAVHDHFRIWKKARRGHAMRIRGPDADGRC
jgi:hypothetical protein